MRWDKVLAGTGAGVVAGLVFGAMMQVMTAPAPDGARMPVMAMVAKIVRSDSLVVGWMYHLFNSVVIGAVFGVLAGRVSSYGAGVAWGAMYGALWWVLGGLVLMPVLLGMPAFAPVIMEPMRPGAVGSLVGHLVYGVVLGGVHVGLVRRSETPAAHLRRAA